MMLVHELELTWQALTLWLTLTGLAIVTRIGNYETRYDALFVTAVA